MVRSPPGVSAIRRTNFSSASMDRNRELGVITTLSTIVDAINAVVSADFTQCAAATDCRSYD